MANEELIASRKCAYPGCDERVSHHAVAYCSAECRSMASDQRREEKHIRKIFEQAELAPKTESCRGCPGGFTYEDETGSCWCMCGRDASNIKAPLPRVA